ncbi:acetate kinase [Filimonas zeae]|uniref:Acetate kinase n=1 Tax=Filimonas zeae TaxID=1737353 RepID=A0A917IZW7_9BACT|nr:acetate/propionate family kinase [Filimonas zeae]MDR6338807.1 acetate kinase [Filimonas zeae]GGH66504.1 acetate kinase [Filimonas zeae]
MAGLHKWILVINCGSSSIKFALYEMADISMRIRGTLTGIGKENGHFSATGATGKVITDETVHLPGNQDAFGHLLNWLRYIGYEKQLYTISHRIVQGGLHHSAPEKVTEQLLQQLEQLVPMAPLHLPAELSGIRFFQQQYPDITQVVCFDTAFHQTMPCTAKHYALPQALTREGVIRYGFHGLSYNYIVHTLQPAGKTIIAHLGNGASMAAINGQQSVDTTMGFTPTGGLVMGTRPGDLDPGVLLYLLQQQKLSPHQLHQLLNSQSGLLGVSGLSADMQQLVEAAPENPQAAEAIELFCYQARKQLGAMAAAMGGLQTLVFTGGIGQHLPAVRAGICHNMAFLGIVLDETRNQENAAVISHRASAVTIRVVATDEEWMIAHHTAQLLKQ